MAKKQNKTRNLNSKIRQEVAIVIIMLFTALSFIALTDPNITGFITVANERSFQDNLTMQINESTEFIWSPDNKGLMKSLRVSGSIENEGSAKVYIVHKNQTILVYDSSKVTAESVLSEITGLVIDNSTVNNETNDNNSESVNETNESSDTNNENQTTENNGTEESVNSAPVWSSNLENLTLNDLTTLTLTDHFIDADNDSLIFSTNTVSGITSSITESVLEIVPDNNTYLETSITIAAFDGTDISFKSLDLIINTSLNITIETNETINITNTTIANETVLNETIINETNQTNETEEIDYPEKNISIDLSYKTNTEYDIDDNGIESTSGIIDFTLQQTTFNWTVDETKLCSIWNIHSLDNNTDNYVCHGSAQCCSFLDLESTASSWNETYYSYYGLDGATKQNVISAQVAFIDYNLSIENPYSDIVYSEWKNLSAIYYAGSIPIDSVCQDSCLLSGFNATFYKVIVEINNTVLSLDSMDYVIEEQIDLETELKFISNISNVTVPNNRNFTLNLSPHFNGTNLTYTAWNETQNLSIVFHNNTAIIVPQKDFIGQRFSFIVADQFGSKEVSNIFMIDVVEPKEVQQHQAVVGKPVKWVKTTKPKDGVVNISAFALNMTIKSVDANGTEIINETDFTITDKGEEKSLDEFVDSRKQREIAKQLKEEEDPEQIRELTEELKEVKQKPGLIESIFSPGSASEITEEDLVVQNISENETIIIELETEAEEVEIEYYTEAPILEETNVTEDLKQIVVSSDVHYENILAHVTIPDIRRERIQIFQTTNNTYVPVQITRYHDHNNNSLIDEVEWIVPHLSNQTYDLVIEISSAIHLNESRIDIDDVFDEVKEKDGNWSVPIHENEYIRVTFVENLTSYNDITVYVRNNQSYNSSIEVYLEDSDELIESYPTITEEGYYKIYLRNLIGKHDTFDLKVVNFDNIIIPNGSNATNLTPFLEFDHIIDPGTAPDIRLLRPFNGSVVDPEINFTDVVLNVSVLDPDNDNLDIYIWGSNSTEQLQAGNNSLLAVFKDVSGTDGWYNASYNWTSPIVTPETGRSGSNGPVLIMHFDNMTELGENDSQVFDFSGLENNGTCRLDLSDCPIYNFTDSKFGAALDFDGIDDYIDLGEPTALDLSTNSEIAITAWVNVDSFPTASNNLAYIVGKGYDGSLEAYLFRLYETGGVDYLEAGSYDGSNHLTQWQIEGWNTDEWHHVAGVYDGSAWRVYFDGVEKASTTTDGPESNNQDVFVGGFDNQGTPGRFFNGTIDEVAIWNRSLSEEEVLDLYRLKNGTYYWKVNASDSTLFEENGTYEFYVMSEFNNLSIGIRTLNDSYGANQLVNLTDPPSIYLGEFDTQPNAQHESKETSQPSNSITSRAITEIKDTNFNLATLLLILSVSILLSLSVAGFATQKPPMALGMLFLAIAILAVPFIYSIAGVGDGYEIEASSTPFASDHHANGSDYNLSFELKEPPAGKGTDQSSFNVSIGTIYMSSQLNYPIYTKFDGHTTDFNSLTSLESVCDATLEIQEYGRIESPNCINVNGMDYDVNVFINDSYVDVKAENLDLSHNTSANITLYGLNHIAYPKVLKDGEVCRDCEILEWDFSERIVRFNTSSFSNLSIEEANQSKIANPGTGEEYLILLKVEFWNETDQTWVQNSVMVNDTEPRFLKNGTQIKLDKLFNGRWNTTANASNGEGTYRVWVGAYHENGSIIVDFEGNNITASHNFTVEDYDVPVIFASLNDTDYRTNNVLNLTANVSDDTGVSSCIISYNESGIVEFFNFTVFGTSDQCSYAFPITVTDGTVINYSVWVNDTSNQGAKEDFIISVRDITLPTLKSFINKTTGILLDDILNASFNASDNLGLDVGQVVLNDTGAYRYYNFSLSGTEDQFSQNFSLACGVGCVINVTGRVNDTSGNVHINSTLLTPLEFTIPRVNSSINITNPRYNWTVNVSANVTDDSALATCQFTTNQTGVVEYLNQTISGTDQECSQNWTITVGRANAVNFTAIVIDTSGNTNQSENIIEVANTPPSKMNLLAPSIHNTSINRSPIFIWENITDVDGDVLNFTLHIRCVECESDSRLLNITGQANYTIENPLKFLGDEGYFYNWTVQANDGFGYGEISNASNLTINSFVSISMPVDSVDFGSLSLGEENTTHVDSPDPFTVENDGNVNVNISIWTNQSIWLSEALPTDSFQFKVANTSETPSYDWNYVNTSINWTNFTTSPVLSLVNLSYLDQNDSAEIDIRVQVPLDEPAGTRAVKVVLEAILA